MNTSSFFKYFAVICISLMLPISALAHHSYAATFELETVNELEGEVVSLQWKNPHIVFDLQTDDGMYQIESHSLSIMRRTGITSDALNVGDRIRVAGNPARDQSKSLFVLNALLAEGNEIVFDPFIGPRWSENIGSNDIWLATEDDAEASDSGVFRVWSTSVEDIFAAFPFPEQFDPSAINNYPLTAAAREVVDNFNPFTDLPTLNCGIKGMPAIMEQPYPMEISRQGENILMRLEEYDTQRMVYRDGRSAEGQPLSLLGFSTGRWEGDTLVVNTTHVSYPYFDSVGIPQSTDVEITERFIPSEDGRRMDYELRVSDPATFTEPVNLSKYWLALPGASVQPYICDDA